MLTLFLSLLAFLLIRLFKENSVTQPGRQKRQPNAGKMGQGVSPVPAVCQKFCGKTNQKG